MPGTRSTSWSAKIAGRVVLVLLVADDVGKVLDEIAAAGDVQHLAPSADGEHRHVAIERSLEQRELGVVPLPRDAERLLVRLLAVELGIEVRAAGEDEPVEPVESLVDRVVGRRHE